MAGRGQKPRSLDRDIRQAGRWAKLKEIRERGISLEVLNAVLWGMPARSHLPPDVRLSQRMSSGAS